MELSIVVILLLFGCIIYFYNSLVKNRNYVKDAWAGIEVQLTKRHDLVPALVRIVKAYSHHESELQEKVTQIRTPQVSRDTSQTESEEHSFAGALSKLLILVEEYPELRADKNFRKLHEQLVIIESDIESARRYYNGTVRDLNILVESFPSNLLANVFSFQPAAFFKLRVASIAESPVVDLSI